jgi:hypothetical protein
MSIQGEFASQILNDPGIEPGKSQFHDAEAFFLGRRQIAHFSGKNEIEIRVTRKQIKELLKSGDKRCKLRSPGSDWIKYQFKTEQDIIRGLELIALAVKMNR